MCGYHDQRICHDHDHCGVKETGVCDIDGETQEMSSPVQIEVGLPVVSTNF